MNVGPQVHTERRLVAALSLSVKAGDLTTTSRGSQPIHLGSHLVARGRRGSGAAASRCLRDLIAVSVQFEYDPDEQATKITTQSVHKSNSKTYV